MTPEWSYKIDADNITATPWRKTISPDEEERKHLARRLKVLSLDRLEADMHVNREAGSRLIHVQGTLRAAVTQECVVTLEPVTEDITETFESWYADPEKVVSLTKARHERMSKVADMELPVLDEKDDPEPVVDGQIDLGEIVTQFLSLSINPYPHKEGVDLEKAIPAGGKKIPPVRQNPFAALKDWKKKDKGE